MRQSNSQLYERKQSSSKGDLSSTGIIQATNKNSCEASDVLIHSMKGLPASDKVIDYGARSEGSVTKIGDHPHPISTVHGGSGVAISGADEVNKGFKS